MGEQFWLFKTEPSTYSFDDLVRDGVAEWDGVRNYQVRNWIRDSIQVGDGILFYHSVTGPVGVVGTARVVRAAYPDHTAWDPESAHPDPRSTPENPTWYMVDIAPDRKFERVVTLDVMRGVPALSSMMALKRGNRLSITPVTRVEFDAVVRMGQRDEP